VKPGGGAILLGATSIAVLAAVVAGFLALGSPGDERLRQLDQRRIEDLRDIANAVQLYYDPAHGRGLPDSLGTSEVLRYLNRGMQDPVTRAPYGYRVLGPKSFELCATFQTAAGDSETYDVDRMWGHPAGRACFEFDVDAEERSYPLVPVRPSASPALRPTPPSGAR
jgi:hypothetical protein